MNHFKKGTGEFIGFSITSVMLLFILLIFVTLSGLLNGITAIQSSSAIVARSIVTVKDKKTAKAQAKAMAEQLLKQYKNCDKISTKVEYTPGCDKWEKGAFVLVTVTARVKTYDPFTTKKHSYSTLVMIEKNSDNQLQNEYLNMDFSSQAGANDIDKWLGCVEAMRVKMLQNHFRYSINNNKSTYDKARDSNRTSNCNYFISWALQEYGSLPKGQVIYLDTNDVGGSGSSYVKSHKNKFEVSYPKKIPDAANLQPGDIVGFSDKMHGAVYGGKDSKGRNVWYTAGSQTGCDGNGNFDEDKLKLRHIKDYDSKIIGVVVRIVPENVS